MRLTILCEIVPKEFRSEKSANHFKIAKNLYFWHQYLNLF